jgi:signal transduction histidine kinase
VDTSDRKRAVRRLFWQAWRGALAGNAVAVVVIGTTMAVSMGVYAPEVPYGRLMRQLVIIAVAMTPPTLLGTIIAGKWLIARSMGWFTESRAPTPKELRRFAAWPRVVALVNLVAWALIFAAHTEYLTHVIETPFGSWTLPKAAAIYGYGYFVGTALAYLLVERRFRPYQEALLPRDVEAWPRSLGIGLRLMAAWFTVSGAPLMLIAFTWVGLTARQRVAAAPALRATALVAAAVGMLVFLIAGRTITGPIRRLQAAQRRVAGGDLSVHVDVEQTGEIGQLEAGFNHMVDGLAVLGSDNARLQEELRTQLEEVRASRIRIVEAADAERARIERNLHDGAQQRLLSVAFAVRAAERSVRAGDAGADEQLRLALCELDAAMTELRELARGIHPAILDEEGLGPALASLAERAAVPVELDVRLPERLPSAVEVTAYFVAAEALTNIARYADASTATIDAEVTGGALNLRIRDDGKGGADPQFGSGLRGLLDRISALGGEFAVDSREGAGTSVIARIPCA